MTKEPAGTIGTSVSAVLVAVFLVLRAAGVVIPEDMETSVTMLSLAVCAVPAVSGWLTRYFVVAPGTAADAVATAMRRRPAQPAPGIDVPGYEDRLQYRGYTVGPSSE